MNWHFLDYLLKCPSKLFDSPPPRARTKDERARQPQPESVLHLCMYACVGVVTANHVGRKSQMHDQLCEEARGENVKERQRGNIIISSFICWTITVEEGREKIREDDKVMEEDRTERAMGG